MSLSLLGDDVNCDFDGLTGTNFPDAGEDCDAEEREDVVAVASAVVVDVGPEASAGGNDSALIPPVSVLSDSGKGLGSSSVRSSTAGDSTLCIPTASGSNSIIGAGGATATGSPPPVPVASININSRSTGPGKRHSVSPSPQPSGRRKGGMERRRSMASAEDENDFDDDGRPLNARALAKVIAEAVSKAPRQFREPNCSPIIEALRLMRGDPDSEAKALHQCCKSADFAMNSVVETYYEGFNKSIKSCSKFLSIVSSGENSSEALQEYVIQIRVLLDKNISGLKTEWAEYLEQAKLIELINKIRKRKWLSTATREIEELIKGRWFVHAAELLRQAIDVSADLILQKVDTVQDISSQLQEMKKDFTTVVTKKICEHVYLRFSGTAPSKTKANADTPVKIPEFSTIEGLLPDSVFLSQEDCSSGTDPEAEPRVFLRNCVAALEKMGLATYVAKQLENAKQEIVRLLEDHNITVPFSNNSSSEPILKVDEKDFPEAFKTATDCFCAALKNHGYLSQVFKSLSPTSSYNLSTIWAQGQDVIKDALAPYLLSATFDNIPTVSLLVDSRPKIFSFGHSSSYFFETTLKTAARPSFGADLRSISKLYPILLRFDNQVQEIFACHQLKPAAATPLRDFVQGFTQQNFLPLLEKDTKNKTRLILEASDAFKPTEMLSSTSKASCIQLLQCAQKMISLLEDVVEIIQAFEGSIQSSFIHIFHETLSSFVEMCSLKYSWVLGVKRETLPLTMTALLLTGQDCALWINQLQADPLWPDYSRRGSGQAFFTNKLVGKDPQFNFYECEILLDRYVHDPSFMIQRDQLILDPQKIALLANLCETMEWCHSRVSAIFVNAREKGTHNRFITKPEGAWSVFIEQNRQPILQSFKDMANSSLMVLRLEYRLHCFHFLSLFKTKSYTREERLPLPDVFIVELNKDLLQAEEILLCLLSEKKARFVLDGLAELIGTLLIRSVGTMSAVNTNAIPKLCKNVFTLQRNLTRIMHKKEFHMDHARKYFDLLALDERELLNHIRDQVDQGHIESGNIFQYEEYRTLLEVHQLNATNNNNASNMGNRKVDPIILKELNNILPMTYNKNSSPSGSAPSSISYNRHCVSTLCQPFPTKRL
ncbi:exocyst complex component 4 [Pelomyxa schiedti]|nr:exocyst complex component 4 [Pelomyxa schiedti]